MKSSLRKSLWSLVSLLLLTGCVGNAPSLPPADVPPVIDDDPTDNPPGDDNPTVTPGVDDQPTDIPEEDEDIAFDTSIGKEVATAASYLDEVPYLLPSEGEGIRQKKQADRPISYEGIPQDEDGYYDISTPPNSFYDQFSDGAFAINWFRAFDNQLNNAKSVKDEAFRNCRSLNEWAHDCLILFDVNTKKLDFCKKYTTPMSASTGESWDALVFSKGDIFKDANGKINYRYSEIQIDLGMTECEPIYHQRNVSYKEDEYYICNQCSRGYTPEKDKMISEGMNTLYMDMSNTNVMYNFVLERRFDNPNGQASLEVSKLVTDFEKRISIEYPFHLSDPSFHMAVTFSLYDDAWHSAVKKSGETVMINLYDFDGWDYFRVKSFEGFNNDIKFKLSNNNINEVGLHPGITSSIYHNWDGYDYFIGYPFLSIDCPSYESFESYLNLAGLSYKGKTEDLSSIKQYYDGELGYGLFGTDLGDFSDEEVVDLVESVCDDYKYSEIEKILNLEAEPIPLGTSIIDQLFEVKGGVVFNEEKILLSELDVAVKDNPYLVPGQEYDCSIQLLDSDEYPIETIGKASFIYGTDEKLHFEDAALQELAAKISKGKYYLALDFNGYQTLLTFGGDKTKLDFEYHDHMWGLDEEGNYQITISDKTLSIHAKKGHQFLIKVKHEKEIVASDQIVVDEENHMLIYHCEKCGETLVFEYPVEEEPPVDPNAGGGEEPPADGDPGTNEEPPADPNPGTGGEPTTDGEPENNQNE